MTATRAVRPHRRAALAAHLAVLAGLAWSAAGPARAQDGGAALAALQAGGAVALIRHASAPGTGDPPGFRLGDCATQRNLSEGGRREAAELGTALRARGVRVAQVRSSRWCRARDTAALAFPDIPATADPALDSFIADRAEEPGRSERVRAAIAAWRGRAGVLALVTHQVNVTALTSIYPAEGEIVVVAPNAGGFDVVGRLRP